MKKFGVSLIEARDLNEAYFKLINDCWNKGEKYLIDSGSNKGGYRIELPFASGFIHYPHTRPLAPTMPEGVSPTTNDEKIEKYFTNYLMDSHLEENEEYKYATWINGSLINPVSGRFETQLEWCIDHFRNNGYGNNHCYITVGTPSINFNYDFPYKTETGRRTSPCLRGIDLKIKENQLILGVVFRSWDLYAGFPENMGGFTLLNEYIAMQLDIEPGPLTFASQGLHCYNYQISSIMSYLRTEVDHHPI